MLTWEIFTNEGAEGTIARSSDLEAGSNGDTDPCHYEVWQSSDGTYWGELYRGDDRLTYWDAEDPFQAIAYCQEHYATQVV